MPLTELVSPQPILFSLWIPNFKTVFYIAVVLNLSSAVTL